MKFTQDQLTTNSKFDRSYEYDHMGRVIKGLSGAEARGGAATDDRPYNETLAYDAMNHLTTLDRRNWDRFDGSGPDTFVNNRVQGWIYDADGRALSTSIGYYTYDAAGRVRSFGDDAPYKTEQEFTGEGRRAKTVAQRYDEPLDQFVTEKITYYLTSTVLGGALVTEMSEQGAKERTPVHAGGSVLASQKITSGTESVEWEHRDASGASYRVTNSAGDWTQPAEMDAVGANAGMFKPFTWNVPDKQGLPVPYPGVADMINHPGGACTLDRMPIPCEIFNNLMNAGGVEVEQLIRVPETPTLIPQGGTRNQQAARWTWETQRTGFRNFGLGLFGTELQVGWGVDNEGGYAAEFAELLIVFESDGDPQNTSQTPRDTRSSNQKACDDKIAGIFGGPGTVAATLAEPTTLLSDNRNRDRGLTYRHLAGGGVFHLYTNAQGTEATVGLYKPPGGRLVSGGEYDNAGDTENYFRFSYTRGPLKGVTLSFVHVGGTHGGDADGQFMGRFPGEPNRIGNIGGLGGEGFGYNHTHVKMHFKGKLTDPRKIFCKEFGF